MMLADGEWCLQMMNNNLVMVNDACGIMYSFVKSRCFTNKVHTLSTVLLTCTAASPRVPSMIICGNYMSYKQILHM